MSMHPDPSVADGHRQGPDLVTPSAASATPTNVLLGGNHRLTEETDVLRQTRLRAAGIFILVALAAGLARDWLVGDTAVWPLQVAVMFALAGSVLVLSEWGSVAGRWLRIFEYVIFGLTACVFAVRQYHTTVVVIGHAGIEAVPLAAKDALLRSVLLMVSYGMLIPNTWRQAARVVLAIGVVPVVTEALLLVAHPEVRRAVGTGATFDRISGNVLFLATGAGLAVYGPYVFQTLRRTAFEARRLNQYRLVRRLALAGWARFTSRSTRC